MSLFKQDPGPCPICGAAHATCTTTSGPPTVALLPMRDAELSRNETASIGQSGEVETTHAVGPANDAVTQPLGDGTDARPFSTATYRGQKKRR